MSCLSLVSLLLAKGADVDGRRALEVCGSPLQKALASLYDAIKHFRPRPSGPCGYQMQKGLLKRLIVVELLLARGADVNARGSAPLFRPQNQVYELTPLPEILARRVFQMMERLPADGAPAWDGSEEVCFESSYGSGVVGQKHYQARYHKIIKFLLYNINSFRNRFLYGWG
ncbi:hypothetical protein ABW19_dt0202605 [Dactylella cylindrospora]|nr:hypothetical protein ABW19_dt0202605 [Dactylella cylindrospora]